MRVECRSVTGAGRPGDGPAADQVTHKHGTSQRPSDWFRRPLDGVDLPARAGPRGRLLLVGGRPRTLLELLVRRQSERAAARDRAGGSAAAAGRAGRSAVPDGGTAREGQAQVLAARRQERRHDPRGAQRRVQGRRAGRIHQHAGLCPQAGDHRGQPAARPGAEPDEHGPAHSRPAGGRRSLRCRHAEQPQLCAVQRVRCLRDVARSAADGEPLPAVLPPARPDLQGDRPSHRAASTIG